MPELGKYADTVILAYAVSFGFLIALVVVTYLQSRKSKQILNKVEAQNGK